MKGGGGTNEELNEPNDATEERELALGSDAIWGGENDVAGDTIDDDAGGGGPIDATGGGIKDAPDVTGGGTKYAPDMTGGGGTKDARGSTKDANDADGGGGTRDVRDVRDASEE